jgi:uncharacterized membrane protein YhaH (DUF805 family)
METMFMPLARYADFSGRASRSEYWMFALLQIFIIFGMAVVFGIFAGFSRDTAGKGDAIFIGVFLLVAYLLIFFVPTIAVTVRRLHDQDKSGWFYLFNFIPYIGGLVMFVFMLLPGTDGSNQYGSRDY